LNTLGECQDSGVDLAKGKQVYEQFCATCHGALGDGKGPVGTAIDPAPRDFTTGMYAFDTDGDGRTGTDADLTRVILDGAAFFGGSVLMAPWSTSLSESQVKDVIGYIRTLER
jgi:mono/diheme cytochrome c family protein